MKVLLYSLAACVAFAAAQERPVLPRFGHDEFPEAKTTPLVTPNSGWTANAGYGIKTDSKPYDFNLLEVELQYDLYLHPQHALTFSLAVSGGGKDHNRHITRDGKRVAFSDNYKHFLLSPMVGYRITQPITKRLGLELGAKGGLSIHWLAVDIGRDWSHDDDTVYDPDQNEWVRKHSDGKSRHGVDTNFGYALYGGLTYSITPKADLYLGYAYRGTTTQPKARPAYPAGTEPFRISPMSWHVIHIGVNAHF